MKFNKLLKSRQAKPNTLNLAGGQAYQQTEKMELATIMLTSFLDAQYYRSANATAKRLTELVAKIPDKKFVAKAALYARREAGMRSVSHLVAGELAHSVKGEQWTKDFFDRVVYRADDVLEILSYCMAVYGKPLPNSLKKGLGKALARFDAYQLAKYRKDGAELKMVDAVNLVHPPHTPAIASLVKGELAPAETWETKLTQAGQQADSDTDKESKKAQAWSDLIGSRKIGYFALLRNLRNILEQAPDEIDRVEAMLVDEKLVQSSKVLPFRYRSALDALEQADLPRKSRQRVVRALSQAADLSLGNVPKFPGRTLVALDCSGSMIGKPMKIGSLFASVLYKANDADLMLFSGDAHYTSLNADDATLSLAQRLEEKAQWGGTDFHSIFDRAKGRYDRIVILSDMQAWVGYYCPKAAFENYVQRAGIRPKVFTFDLAGYGSLQFPERDIYSMAGFSDKTLSTMRFLEEDKSALLREIEKVAL